MSQYYYGITLEPIDFYICNYIIYLFIHKCDILFIHINVSNNMFVQVIHPYNGRL